jgi:hypothetical protein
MKRGALVCVALLLSLSIEAQQKQRTFIEYLFGDAATPPIATSMVDSTNRVLSLVRASTVGGKDVYQRAVVYAEAGAKHSIYLLVLGPYIFGSDGTCLIDVSGSPGEFWGWRISILKNIKTGKQIGINLDWFADTGKRTTDAIELIWDEKKDLFTQYKIDQSQY